MFFFNFCKMYIYVILRYIFLSKNAIADNIFYSAKKPAVSGRLFVKGREVLIKTYCFGYFCLFPIKSRNTITQT